VKSLPQLKQLTRAEISEMKSQLKPLMISLKMETSTKQSIIRTAAYSFCCQLCDDHIRQGENYVVMDDFKLCVACGLPERRLRPLKQKELTTNTQTK